MQSFIRASWSNNLLESMYLMDPNWIKIIIFSVAVFDEGRTGNSSAILNYSDFRQTGNSQLAESVAIE